MPVTVKNSTHFKQVCSEWDKGQSLCPISGEPFSHFPSSPKPLTIIAQRAQDTHIVYEPFPRRKCTSRMNGYER